MSKYSERGRIRKKMLKEQNKERQREKQRLKALPKVLRKLESDLDTYVEFMLVYDGYIGGFTGDLIPVNPVDNPFAIIHEMGLDFPAQNSLTEEETKLYIEKISEALNRMCFDFYSDSPEIYELLLFHIENLSSEIFGSFTSLKYKNSSLEIRRIDSSDLY